VTFSAARCALGSETVSIAGVPPQIPHCSFTLARHNLDVMPPASPQPMCRWNDAPSGTRKGVRIEVLLPPSRDGEIHVGVSVRCASPSHYLHRSFMEGAVYQAGRVDGVWKILRTVSAFIT
jgi:hypothetical protein